MVSQVHACLRACMHAVYACMRACVHACMHACPAARSSSAWPMLSQGYLVDAKNPDPEVVAKNQTEFITEADGTRYFCTGDIGQVH